MSNIPRFYETNITIGYSSSGNTFITTPIFNTMIDAIPPPATTATRCPAPPPATRCPAPPPATRCPSSAPVTRCPATAPPCPTITKLKVISASINSNGHQQLVIEKPNAWTSYTNRTDFVANNSNIAEVSALPVPTGGMSGGQVDSSSYIFRPESFRMNSNHKVNTDRIPLYFDYYTFFARTSTNIISRETAISAGHINLHLTNALFVLDKNNIPHYLSMVVSEATNELLCYSINKKTNAYMGRYDPISGISYEKRLAVDIRLNSATNNLINLSRLTLMPIPISLNIPNSDYAKSADTNQAPRIAPFVQQPSIPSPAPKPSPAPVPSPVTGG